MIRTCYFAKAAKILEAFPDAYLASIAGKTPEWFAGGAFKELAPKYGWWKEWKEKFASDPESRESVAWYSERYRKTVLDNLNPETFAAKAAEASGGRPVFLLCYERPERFCHRKLVAEWLNAAGIDCSEYGGK